MCRSGSASKAASHHQGSKHLHALSHNYICPLEQPSMVHCKQRGRKYQDNLLYHPDNCKVRVLKHLTYHGSCSWFLRYKAVLPDAPAVLSKLAPSSSAGNKHVKARMGGATLRGCLGQLYAAMLLYEL